MAKKPKFSLVLILKLVNKLFLLCSQFIKLQNTEDVLSSVHVEH